MSDTGYTISYLTSHSKLSELKDLLLTQVYEMKLAPFEEDHEKILTYLEHALVTGRIIVAESNKSGEIVGAIVLILDTIWWATDTFLTELAFYVAPKHRNSSLGTQLLNKALEFAELENKAFLLGLFSSQDLDRKDLFFQRKGFKRIGGQYWKDKG